MDRALAEVPNTIDKRVGSVIYDALAPAIMLLAEGYAKLSTYVVDSLVTTATGEALDDHGRVYGVSRVVDTPSEFTLTIGNIADNEVLEDLVGELYQDTDLGMTYIITEYISGAQYKAATERTGVSSALIPTNPVGVDSEHTVQYVVLDKYGSDYESDDDYRDRIINRIIHPITIGSIGSIKETIQGFLKSGYSRVYAPDLPTNFSIDIYCVDNNLLPLTATSKNILKELLKDRIAPGFVLNIYDPNIKSFELEIKATATGPIGSYISNIRTILVRMLRNEANRRWGMILNDGTPSTQMVISVTTVRDYLYEIQGILSVQQVLMKKSGTSSYITEYSLDLSKESCEWIQFSNITVTEG
jgi:hypothetical protein